MDGFSLAVACKIVNDLINILGDSVMARSDLSRSHARLANSCKRHCPPINKLCLSILIAFLFRSRELLKKLLSIEFLRIARFWVESQTRANAARFCLN